MWDRLRIQSTALYTPTVLTGLGKVLSLHFALVASPELVHAKQ